MQDTRLEVAGLAARWVVEDGLEFGMAKRRAMESLGLRGRSVQPDNLMVEDAVRDYIATFCPESQAQELMALRRCALYWMDRLAPFRPYLFGAVWSGIATRWSDIHLSLFCDDPKLAELFLIDQRVQYRAGAHEGNRGSPLSVLSIDYFCKDLAENVGVHLSIHEADDLRFAPRLDAKGRPLRGDGQAVRALVEEKI